jgi:PAS domain S-box-containing protein
MNELDRYGTSSLHALLELVDGGVVLHDADGTIVSCTAAAERVLRLPAMQLAGRQGVLAHVRARDESGTAWSATSEPAAEALRTRRAAAPRLARFRAPEGDDVWVSLASAPVCEPRTGEVRAVLTRVTDVSERKALERQLEGRNRLVAVGRVAGGIAHDFNNLLTVILGHSEHLMHSLLPVDPCRREAEAVHQAACRGADLTRQLLAFSRGRAVESRDLDLNEVVIEMEPMLRRLAGPAIQLSVRAHRGPVPVHADHGQLEQVLMNLVLNSRDALPTGGRIWIETDTERLDEEFVSTHAGSRTGAHAVLRVRDDGCGMDAVTQARIFEPFFTTKPAQKGTGLGLATVYGIVKQGGGYVGVNSAPGAGAEFALYLPWRGVAREGVPSG